MVGLSQTFPVYCLHVVGLSQTFPVSGLPLSHLLVPPYLRFFPEQRKSRSSSFSLQTGFRQNASTLILGIQSLPVRACSNKIFLWPLIENRSFLHICESRRINKDRHTRARKIRCKHVTADKHTGTANIHTVASSHRGGLGWLAHCVWTTTGKGGEAPEQMLWA